MFLTWGNHDVRGKRAYQMPDVIATPSGRPYYAFRSGPVGVICLHTGEDKPDAHPSFNGRVAFDSLRAEQTKWLEQVINDPALRDAPYRIVFCHIPLRWKKEVIPDYDKGGYDWFSYRSRDAWHPHLVKWKAQTIISGHTHEPALLPPNAEFPYAQLVGGGPSKAEATWMEGVADGRNLMIRVKDLTGKELHVIRLDPLA